MRTLLLFPLLFAPAALLAAAGADPGLVFEPNRGQTDAAVRYLARSASGTLFFTDGEVVLHRPSEKGAADATLRFEFPGSDRAAHWEGGERGPETTSYILGRDPARWVRDVGQYRQLVRRGVYPGIDMTWYGNTGLLEYDFLVAAHADPARIRMRVNGASGLSLEADGALRIATSAGVVYQHRPRIFQTLASGERRPVAGGFRLTGARTVAFQIGQYDPNLPLTIDPALESSTYLGGNGDDRLVVAYAPDRYAGSTASIDFPGSTFARRKGSDIVVNNGLTVYVIGGSGNDEVTAVYMPPFSPGGDVAVVGYTDSKDLPTNISTLPRVNPTPAIWQADFAGGATDGFFLWINQANTAAPPSIYLSYIGTPGDDRLTGISTGYPYSGFALVGITNGTGLPAAPSGWQVPQATPAGGFDGFLMVVTQFINAPTIVLSTYFGGSGDDRPAAVFTTTTGYYITGETASPDFPLVNPISAARGGTSDAFVMCITPRFPYLQIVGSTLLGGSGADRGTALTFQNNNLVIAGVTSSTDLPVANAVQSAYGGGASDIFLAHLTPDLSQLRSLTYYGGSGSEEASSVAGDGVGHLYAAGWTSSTDFPVRNALQASYGGGPDDGFLLDFDQDESLYAATYFGGSGSDRILGVTAANDFTVWIAGQTTSRDLPLQTATQSAIDGPSDSFAARISAALISGSRAIGAKGLRGFGGVTVGLLNGTLDATVTIISKDPASVRLAPDTGSPSQASLALPANPDFSSNFRRYYVDCQVETGGADLTISAPGYPDRTGRVDCYPLQLAVTQYLGIVADAQGNARTIPWIRPASIAVQLVAVNPARPSDSATVVPPDGPPVTVQIANSNPTAAKVDASFTIDGIARSAFAFQGLAPGDVQLSFSSAGFKIANTIAVSVVSPVSPAGITLPGGFQTGYGLVNGTPPDGTTATITSQDPASLVVSTDLKQAGSASITVPLVNSAVYLQAVASSGDIPVTVSVKGYDTATAIIHLAPPVLYCSSCATGFALGIQESTGVGVRIGTAGDVAAPLRQVTPVPGTLLHVTAQSSDPTVAAVSPAFIDYKPDTPFPGSFSVAGAGPGTAAITFAATGLAIDPGLSPKPVSVRRKPLVMAELDLGKDLAGLMTLSFPSGGNGAVTLTIADPTLAVLSVDNKSAGQRQITVNSGLSTARWYVQGLAASGKTTVTAQVAGFDPITATVTLGPAGMGWTSDSASAVLYGSLPTPNVAAFALDAATQLPVGQQTPRFGTSFAFQVTNSDASIVSFSSNLKMQAGDFAAAVVLTPKAVGSASLSLVQPAGLVTPSIRQQLPVKVLAPSLRVDPATVGKDTQTAFSITVPPGAPGLLTVASADPARLVLSTDSNTPGSASVTFNPATGQRIWAQALDGQGTVRVTASMPGFNDGSGTFTLAALGVGLFVSSPSAQGFSTTTQSPKTGIAVNLYLVNAVTGQILSFGTVGPPRPGIDAPLVTVSSSNPAVGQIDRSPVRATVNNNSNPPSVDFVPVAPGDTDVSVVQPPGYVAPINAATKIAFHVTLPAFSDVNAALARDTMSAIALQLPGNVPPPAANVNVTITSSDPSKVLVSSAIDSAPGASINRVLIAGRNAIDPIYIHALDRSGTVPLKVSAPGYGDSTITVGLSDLAFSFALVGGLPPNSATRVVVQNGPQPYTISFRAVPIPQFASSTNFQLSIRPGAPNIVLNVRTSDSGTLAVDNPQVIVKPGATTASVTARPVSPGPAVLTLDAPDGYVADAAARNLSVSVEGARLSLGQPNFIIGRDLQIAAAIDSEVRIQQPISVTLTSSDPSRLLLSTDPKAPGQPSLSVSAQSFPGTQIWLQSLAESGGATVTAAADGYQPAVVNVTLVPSAAVFSFTSGKQTLFTNTGVENLTVSLSNLDPATLNPSGSFNNPSARPGANLTAAVTTSDQNVIAPSVSVLNFADNPVQNFQVRPVGLGTAVLSIGRLPGGTAAATGAQIAYTVAEPDLFILDITIGRDLQAPLQVRLASRLPAPAADLTLNVGSGDFNMGVSSDGTPVPYPTPIQVVIPAGQHLSKPFLVQGLAVGASRLGVSGPGFNPSTSTVTVAPTTFVIQEASTTPIGLAVGASTNLTVVPALLPLGTASPAGLAIRGGISPIALSLTNSTNLSLTPNAVTFRPGDQQAVIAVRGLAAGNGSVSLGVSTTYQTPNAKSSVNFTVK
jgi:hypothetical protein